MAPCLLGEDSLGLTLGESLLVSLPWVGTAVAVSFVGFAVTRTLKGIMVEVNVGSATGACIGTELGAVAFMRLEITGLLNGSLVGT